MEEFLKFLHQNLFNIEVSFMITFIVNLIVDFMFKFISYKNPRIHTSLSYQVRSLKFTSKSKKLPKSIKNLFHKKDIDTLTKTYIVLWNSGINTIYGHNIVPEDPLRIELDKSIQILQVRILKLTRKINVNKFTAKKDVLSNVIDCNFDYLDAGDGVTIEILHTSEKPNVKIQGTIKELPKGVKNLGTFKEELDYIFIFLNSIYIFGGLSTIVIAVQTVLRKSYTEGLSGPVFLIIIGFFMCLYYFYRIYREWSTRPRFPKSLAIFDSDIYE